MDVDVVISLAWPIVDRPEMGELLQLAVDYDAVIVPMGHPYDDFPPAFARNLGGRWCRREFLTFCDADSVLHPKFAEESLWELECSSVYTTIKTMMTPYPVGAPEYETDSSEAFLRYAQAGRPAPGTGCGTVVPFKVYEELGGLDERFIGYGPTDWDFTRRLPLERVDLTEDYGICLMHQHHDRTMQDKDPNLVESRRRNREIMEGSSDPIRNRNGWGGVK